MDWRIIRSAGLVVACFCLILTPDIARSGQDDPRLNGLFARLEMTQDKGARTSLTSEIWNIWLHYDGSVEKVEWMVSLGMVQMRSRDYSNAEKSFSSAIEADKSFAEAWNRRATLRYLAGDFDGSILDIQQTLVREPRHFGALSGLGMIFMQLEDWQGALAAFQSVLRIIPGDPGALERIEIIERKLSEQSI